MQDLKQGKLIIFLKSTALKYISRFSFCFFTSIAKINVWFYYPLNFLDALKENVFYGLLPLLNTALTLFQPQQLFRYTITPA